MFKLKQKGKTQRFFSYSVYWKKIQKVTIKERIIEMTWGFIKKGEKCVHKT